MIISIILILFVIGTLVPLAAVGDETVENTKLTVKAKGKTLYATLTTAKGKAIKGKKIKFSVKGSNYYATTNAKGVAKVKITYSKIGTHTFTAKFAGDKQYKTVTKKGKFTIPKPTVSITCRPSCGRCSKAYTWRTRKYVSYCPNCHHYGTLHNAHKRNVRHEQELTCSRCDSDFCGNCGKEKMGYSHKYLQKA